MKNVLKLNLNMILHGGWGVLILNFEVLSCLSLLTIVCLFLSKVEGVSCLLSRSFNYF